MTQGGQRPGTTAMNGNGNDATLSNIYAETMAVSGDVTQLMRDVASLQVLLVQKLDGLLAGPSNPDASSLPENAEIDRLTGEVRKFRDEYNRVRSQLDTVNSQYASLSEELTKARRFRDKTKELYDLVGEDFTRICRSGVSNNNTAYIPAWSRFHNGMTYYLWEEGLIPSIS